MSLKWPSQNSTSIENIDVSVKTLLENAKKRFDSEAEGYRSNPTDGNARL